MVAELFKEEVPQKEIRRGILSRLATLNRNEAEHVFTQLDDSPRAIQESRSCRCVALTLSRAGVYRSPLSRSIPDNDLYQDLLDGNEDHSNTEVTIDCPTPSFHERLGEIEEEKDTEEKHLSNNHHIHIEVMNGRICDNSVLFCRKMKLNLETDAVVRWPCQR